MLQRLKTMWRSWRERRGQYQIERALYRAEGHRGPGHGGFDGESQKRPEDLSRIDGGGGPL